MPQIKLLPALAFAGAVLVPGHLAAQGARASVATAAVRAAAPDVCTDTTITSRERVDACRARVKANKDDVAAREALGTALLAAEQYDDAADELERVVKSAPTRVAAWVALRDALVGAERAPAARRAIDRALAANPQSAEAHEMLARWQLEEEVYDSALVHVDHAVKLAPTDARVHDLRGDALYSLDRDGEALAAYREAVRLDPALRAPRLGVAMVLRDQKKYAEAIPHYDAILKRNPKDLWVSRQKAEALAALKRMPEAEKVLVAAMKADPQNDETHFQYADFLTDRDRWADALPHYREAVRLDSTDATNRHDYGVALVQTDKPAPALEQFLAAVQLNPRFGRARGNAIDLLIAAKRVDEALRMADGWVEHASDDDAAPHAARGYALRLLGRNGDARKALDRALDRDSVHFGARVNHGIIMLAERRLDDAGHDAEVLMRIAPDRMNGFALAGFVALAQGRCAEVVQHWGAANRIEPGWTNKDENVAKAYRECRQRAGAEKSKR